MIVNAMDFFNTHNILAFLPTYDTNGRNITKVYLLNGDTLLVPYTLKKFIPKLATHNHIPWAYLKEWTYQMIAAKSSFPIVLDPDIVFIPFHARTCVASQDGATGYILSSSIASIASDTIHLTNGHSFQSKTSSKCLFSKITNGNYLASAFADAMGKAHSLAKSLPFHHEVIEYIEDPSCDSPKQETG
jgi:hypothetical protein